MEYKQHGKFLRVEIDDFTNVEDVIQQIQRHVDGISVVTEDCDEVTYVVDGYEHHHKAEAILAELGLEDDADVDIIYTSMTKPEAYIVGCSRKENDTSLNPSETDRTRHYAKNCYDIIEILWSQSYIHYFSDNMSEDLRKAFKIVSETIISSKNEKNK